MTPPEEIWLINLLMSKHLVRPEHLITKRWSKDCRLKSIAHARSVYDIVLCVYERFRVDGWKRYVNDDRFRVDGDKNIRLLAFAFTIVFVWTGPKNTVIELF